MNNYEITILNNMTKKEKKYFFKHYYFCSIVKKALIFMLFLSSLSLILTIFKRYQVFQMNDLLKPLSYFMLCFLGYSYIKTCAYFQMGKYKKLLLSSDKIYIDGYELEHDIKIIFSKNYLILTKSVSTRRTVAKDKRIIGIVIFIIPQDVHENLIDWVKASAYNNFEIYNDSFDVVYYRIKNKFRH